MSRLWEQKVSAFLLSPTQFLATTTPENFLAELLRDLRNDKSSDQLKMLLASVLMETPTLLCPSGVAAEEAALELMSLYSHVPQRSAGVRHALMPALTSLIICCGARTAARDWLDLLFHTIQDTNDYRGGAGQQRVRASACECLRELEACEPGLLAPKLETLHLLARQETSVLQQNYCLLYSLALRHALHALSRRGHASDPQLKSLLGANEGFEPKRSPSPPPLRLVPPPLPSGLDCRELRAVLSPLLEECYLLTGPAQAALLGELVEVVLAVPGLSPASFKSQLLRVLGTARVELMHAALLTKDAFTDSLFTAEDESFLIKRLVAMARHPLLPVAHKLFYVDCLLHFPENRPIASSAEESLPVLVTPRLAAPLMPTVFHDSATVLCRLNLLCLVHLEAGEGEAAPLLEHVLALLGVVEGGGGREVVVTAFRAAFLFLLHWGGARELSLALLARLCDLYSAHPWLAPHLIGLADRLQEALGDPAWSLQLLRGLRQRMVPAQLSAHSLSWHLRLLRRVAGEAGIAQRDTVYLLLDVLLNSSLCARGGWRAGNGVLAVCRRLLEHPAVDRVFVELADLLRFISTRYHDTDVRDRARLYYALLTDLSRDKLSALLATAPDGGRAKERSHSAGAESEGVAADLTVHRAERPVLQLVRLQGAEPRGARLTQEAGEGQDWLQVYRAQFQTPGFGSEVTLRFSLCHAPQADAPFDRLFSVCLRFTLDDRNYARVSDVLVPCVFRERAAPELRLTLRPVRPRPTSLAVSALFTTPDGRSWCSALPDLSVSFPELFLPLPSPPLWPRPQEEEVFQRLWDAAAAGDPDTSATSLFCFEAEPQALEDLIGRHFQHYLIAAEAGLRRWKVLLFLPPACHVLLRVEGAELAARVHIATDDWELLPHVNQFLQSITSHAAHTHTHTRILIY